RRAAEATATFNTTRVEATRGSGVFARTAQADAGAFEEDLVERADHALSDHLAVDFAGATVGCVIDGAFNASDVGTLTKIALAGLTGIRATTAGGTALTVVAASITRSGSRASRSQLDKSDSED